MIDALGTDAHWTGRELLDQVPRDLVISGRDVVEKLSLRDKLRVRLLRRMQKTPVVLMPVCSVPAFLPREREWDVEGRKVDLREMVSCATPSNLFGLPAMTIPFGKTESGLPVGIQLVSRFGDEATLYRLAGQIERARPWRGRRPPVHAGR